MNDVACLGSEFSLFDCDLSSNAYTENNAGNYATIKCWKKGIVQSKANNNMYISSNPKRFGSLTAWTKHIVIMDEYLIIFIWNQFFLIFKVGSFCTHGNVRLSNGSTNYGRVEVCQFQEWGSICDNSWDRNDASVICKMNNFDPSCKQKI